MSIDKFQIVDKNHPEKNLIVLIRPITDNYSDYECYCKLIGQLTSQFKHLSYETFHSTINDLKNELIAVCEVDNVVVGTIKVIMERKLYSDKCFVAHIEDVVIDLDYRGLGLGQNIVDYALRFAQEMDCYKVKLYCKESNVAFYEKSGFHIDCIDMVKRF